MCLCVFAGIGQAGAKVPQHCGHIDILPAGLPGRSEPNLNEASRAIASTNEEGQRERSFPNRG